MPMEFNNASADAGLPNRWIPEFKSRQLTVEEIHGFVEAMAGAAYLCKQNGVDGIDVHAVHEEYLLDQFTNLRIGISIKKQMRHQGLSEDKGCHFRIWLIVY